MLYHSTGGKSPDVNFEDALMSGLAPDKGLYMPNKIPAIEIGSLFGKKFNEMAFIITKALIDGEIPDGDLRAIVDDAFNFEVPVVNLKDNIYSLELFHGPTAAFKDFGARFMARAMSYFLSRNRRKIRILVATSGDTGSAVAHGFYNVPGIDVTILYPSGRVSPLQEKQLTTLGGNITALEVKGSFDDCQSMVKEAFLDSDITGKLNLASANSINIGRLIPQSLYYFYAYTIVAAKPGDPVVFCTPSGNFGNLTGGVLAKKMGLPVDYFIAATNDNDVVPQYLSSGSFDPRPSVTTYSNAMDVGNPSNFYRLLDIYKNRDNMLKDIKGYKVSDTSTLDTIRSVYKDHKYILDPHGAVGYRAAKDFAAKQSSKVPAVFLETAHPSKFLEVIKEALGIDVEIAEVLRSYINKKKVSIVIENRYELLKKYLLDTKK